MKGMKTLFRVTSMPLDFRLPNQSSVKSPPRSASLYPSTQGKKEQDRFNTSYTIFLFLFLFIHERISVKRNIYGL